MQKWVGNPRMPQWSKCAVTWGITEMVAVEAAQSMKEKVSQEA